MKILADPATSLDIRGVQIWPGLLEPPLQRALVDQVRAVVTAAPLFHPETSRGQKMSVRMTSAGTLGWISDRRGYRYEPRHPSGLPWPAIPPLALEVWRAVAGVDRPPDSCLINFYGPEAKMGMHQDRDEADTTWPVVSISLGDEALFRIGNATRGGKTQSIWLGSGDVACLAGPARLLYHGIDRLRAGAAGPLDRPGRLNLTLRVAGDE